MTPADRIRAWLEGLSARWKDLIRGWLRRTLAEGAIKFLGDLEPEAIASVTATLDRLKQDPLTPPDLRALIERMTAGTAPVPVPLLIIVGVLMLAPTIFGIFRPLGTLWEQRQERLFHTARLDPFQAIAAWRRDPAKWETFLNDLGDLGWTDDRIELFKDLTLAIANAPDIVRFAVREVYDPETARRYGQFQDFPDAALPDAARAGLSEDLLRKYWAAHWDLPSATLGYEMLHRGIITAAELSQLLKALDIMPYWRPKLEQISWAVPTRVDVRRFWDLRTIDEPRLRDIYTSLGYHGRDLDDYVLWTKIYVELPELIARYKNGWITLDEVRARLVSFGMNAARAEELLQAKIKAEPDPRTQAEKDLTLTDIYKAVKLARITRAEAVGLIMDLGYTEEQAGFKLDVNVPADSTVPAQQERQLAKSDILAGLKAGILTESGARGMLLDLRYAAVDVDYILQLYRAQVSPPIEPRLREAAKADVLLGVKRGLITPEEGYGMLLDLGFTPEAALFILAVHAEASPLSPATFDELKDRTQQYRRAVGIGGKPVSDKIKAAGALVVKLSAEVDALRRALKAEEATLIPDQVLPETATTRATEIRVALHRAEAELQRVTVDYNALVAEWRHQQ